MKVGLVGFARAGKTTIFNALTGLSAEVGGFEKKREAAIAVVKVPDPRIDALAEIVHPERNKYAEVIFLDFPPPEERKTALETEALVQMREVEALAQVVRAFDDPLSSTSTDPLRELRDFHTELVLADMTVIEKRLDRLKKEKGKERERELLEKCQAILEEEKPLRHVSFLPEEQALLSGFSFLSQKPILVVYNVTEDALKESLPTNVAEYVKKENLIVVPICGKVEMDIAQLDEEERGMFQADLGLMDSAKDRFIQQAYALLNLMSFFTAGPMEARAWTITRGMTAVKAAGKIHSDIERGFIRAEVIAYDEYIRYRGEAGCRDVGKMRLEGKEYVMQDGDVVHFRFKV
ncbi:MAG: redox-regulated ATPase YchF [Deltaproteobacteria bacterium]|nr:redox-regulated ATPase YchF [Deltaproteobacteria bacterium]